MKEVLQQLKDKFKITMEVIKMIMKSIKDSNGIKLFIAKKLENIDKKN